MGNKMDNNKKLTRGSVLSIIGAFGINEVFLKARSTDLDLPELHF